MPFWKSEYVNLRVNPLRWVNSDLKLLGRNPFDELLDTAFYIERVFGTFQLSQYFSRKFFLRLGVRLRQKFELFFTALKRLENCSVSLEADQNSSLLSMFERGIQLVKPADKKVADQAVKEPRVLAQ